MNSGSLNNPTQANPPADERVRLAALREYRILDTPPEEAFDELAALAARICEVPYAFISFVDERRQWNKSRIGVEIVEVPRDVSLCAQAILGEELYVVEDLGLDQRFGRNALVEGVSGIRFYAGSPLVTRFYAASPLRTPGGHALGALCVMDKVPRKLSVDQGRALKTLANQVVSQLELRRSLTETRERKQLVETALKESETFYHSLVDHLPQNIFRKSTEGRFTFANRNFCRTLGRELSEILGKTDFDFFPTELAVKYSRDDRQVIESGTAWSAIEKHQTMDGGEIYVQVIKSPLRDADGRILGVQGIFWDETDRIRAQEALAYERDLLRAILENVPDCVYIKDRQSRFIRCSRELARKLGLNDPREVTGKTDFDYFDEAHAREAYADEQRIIQTGEPMIAKVERDTWHDGRECWVLTTKAPLKTAKGEIIGTFGISRDITEMKRVEKELELARDAAVQSANLKSEFLANMSHEIRTPMNAIIGMTGLVLDTPLTSEQRDFAETIRSSADALLSIINDILDFSKIEAGKLEVERIDFELNQVVEGTVELMAEAALGKNLELACWVHTNVPKCLRGDPGRLRQVLLNLIGNAIKFTPKGEVLVQVSREREAGNKCWIKFEVKDTGIGIPPEAQARIFEAFTQADGSMTRKYGGTGLGLAISKQLIALMGGQIGVVSKTGQGSSFFFTVPLEIRVQEEKVLEDEGHLAGARVLVVDDNATNRIIVEHQVSAWKMHSTSVASGPEALEALRRAARRRTPFHLAVLDMQMPEMDGIQLAREIKADPAIADTALVVLTSLGLFSDDNIWLDAGITAYLVKPVKQSRLHDALLQALHARPAAKANASSELLRSVQFTPSRQARILLAEDNAVNQKVALRQLKKLGYQADPVANGLEVLSALERIPYQIILMDCQMPELDGYEASRRIRKQEEGQSETPRKYIIAMTANALAGDREECLAAGMDDYVSKPVRLEDLEKALERGLRAMGSTRKLFEVSIDPNALQDIRKLRTPGLPDPLHELIDMFLNDSPERLARLESAIKDGRWADVQRAAHNFKGSASNLGAAQLARLCAELLVAAKDPEPATIGSLLDQFRQIKSEYEAVQAQLEIERKK